MLNRAFTALSAEVFQTKFLTFMKVLNKFKIEVLITSVIKMLELPNFGDMTTSTI